MFKSKTRQYEKSHLGKYSYITKQKKQHHRQNITNINLCGTCEYLLFINIKLMHGNNCIV